MTTFSRQDVAETAADPTPAASAPTYSPNAIHLVRTAQQMTLTLSQMADAKASLLMGATFLVFTVTVGQMRGGSLPVPLVVLALFAFCSAICAVFAVMPSVGRPGAKGPVVGKANPLFFGHFVEMSEQDWTDGIMGSLHQDDALLRVMLHDMYQNGQVLQRKKYRYLGYAYRLFVVGLSLTVVLTVVELAGVRLHLG